MSHKITTLQVGTINGGFKTYKSTCECGWSYPPNAALNHGARTGALKSDCMDHARWHRSSVRHEVAS